MGPGAADDDPQGAGFGFDGGVEGVVPALEAAVPRPEGGLQVGQGLLEALPALGGPGESQAEGGVLLLHPAGPHPQVEPAARHLVDGGGVLGDHGRVPEGDGADEDGQPDGGGLSRQSGQGGEGIGGLGGRFPARVVVVGPGEGAETVGLAPARQREELVVGAPQLGLCHAGEFHASRVGPVSQSRRRPTERRMSSRLSKATWK